MMPWSALQRDITFWSSWNWEDPSCQGTCNRSWGKLYQYNWFNSDIKGMLSSILDLDLVTLIICYKQA